MWKSSAYVVVNTDGKKVNKWKRAVIRSAGSDYDYMQSVITEAKNMESNVSCTKYYQCAKFIRDHHTMDYRYKKTVISHLTCCRAYPEICGGKCCNGAYTVCGCDEVPPKYDKVDNCYDDCCVIYRIVNRRKFTITWV